LLRLTYTSGCFCLQSSYWSVQWRLRPLHLGDTAKCLAGLYLNSRRMSTEIPSAVVASHSSTGMSHSLWHLIRSLSNQVRRFASIKCAKKASLSLWRQGRHALNTSTTSTRHQYRILHILCDTKTSQTPNKRRYGIDLPVYTKALAPTSSPPIRHGCLLTPSQSSPPNAPSPSAHSHARTGTSMSSRNKRPAEPRSRGNSPPEKRSRPHERSALQDRVRYVFFPTASRADC
jgi:hypothetical protein